MINKKNKFFYVLLTSIFLVLLIIVYSVLVKKKKIENPVTIVPVSTPYPVQFKTGNSYLINWIKSVESPVNGFSLVNDTLIYSNPNGIYEGYNNKLIQKEKIDKIFWTSQGQALLYNGSSWIFFDFRQNNPSGKKVLINGNNPVLSPDGKYVIDYYTNRIDLINIDSNTSVSQMISSNIDGAFFSRDSTFFIIYSSNMDVVSVYFFDIQFNQMEKIEVQTNDKIIGLTTDKNIVVNRDNVLTLISAQKSLPLYQLQKKSQAFLFYSNDNLNNFLLLEKVPDELGRTIDYLWEINMDGYKELIITSQAVIKRFNRNITPIFDSEKKILLIAENEGVIWMVSLFPDLYPSYTEKGFILTRLNFSDKGI